MKKLFLLLVLIVLPHIVSADDNGTCGDNLNWSYIESSGTLKISGNGAMSNYTSGKKTPYGEEFPKPWPRQNFLVPLQAI